MATGPRTPYPAPTAGPPLIGLLRSSPDIVRGNGRWTNGITYEPEGCVEGVTHDPCDPTDITTPTKPDTVEWEPYILQVAEECSAFSDREDRAARVRRLLEMDTERQLGEELWTGNLTQTASMPGGGDWPNVWLADVANVDILTESGPVSLTHGMSCLEQYIAENNGGQRGMIHATAQVVSQWSFFNLVHDEGRRLVTVNDNIVVVSPGYNGESPDGAVGDDNIWAYATDMVRVFIGDVTTTDQANSFDRENNTIVSVASRPALAEWQRCRHAGVRLALDACDVGGS